MKYVSEYTGKIYDTEIACVEADTAYEAEQEAKTKAAAEFKAKKEAMEKEIDVAYEMAMKAKDNYNNLIKEYEAMFEDDNDECDCDDHCTCGIYKNGKKMNLSNEDMKEVMSILSDIFHIN